MTAIDEHIGIDVPLVVAGAYVTRYLRSLGWRANDAPAVLRLRVKLPKIAVPFDAALDRDVEARFQITRHDPKLPESIAVVWEPKGGGPFPQFFGTLTFWAGEDRATILNLKGSYRPPFGWLGKVFDAALGRKIAQVTGRELLEQFRDGVEHLYKAELALEPGIR